MCKKIVHSGGVSHERKAVLKDIPDDEKCDFRLDYEAGSTLKQIAEKYYCDPRTVRKCILINKSSSELGRQTAPTKLSQYVDLIDSMYHDVVESERSRSKPPGICEISRSITSEIRKKGYSGSERTLRNYLRMKYQFVTEEE